MANPSRALLFYGVVDAHEPQRGNGEAALPVDGVTLIRFRDLGAVVAPAQYARLSPGEEELTDYVRVVDGWYAQGPIIPAPPGTVFRSADVLHHWLEIHYAKLHEALGVIERRASATPPYDFIRMELRG